MKTTILGIEVGKEVVWYFKEYIRTKNFNEELLGEISEWTTGYAYAYAEISLIKAHEAGIITEEQKSILKKFLMNLEFTKTRESIYNKKNIVYPMSQNYHFGTLTVLINLVPCSAFGTLSMLFCSSVMIPSFLASFRLISAYA